MENGQFLRLFQDPNDVPTSVPEPGSVVALLGLGLGFVVAKRKKQA